MGNRTMPSSSTCSSSGRRTTACDGKCWSAIPRGSMATRKHAWRALLMMAIVSMGITAPLAQGTWPGKTITYVVPYPAGGTTDILCRTIAQKLGTALGTTVVVDNKAGATGGRGLHLLWR